MAWNTGESLPCSALTILSKVLAAIEDDESGDLQPSLVPDREGMSVSGADDVGAGGFGLADGVFST